MSEASYPLKGTDVPQFDSLDQIRRAVEAVAAGAAETRDICEATGLSARHVNYAVQAARVLRLMTPDEEVFALGRFGRVLLGLPAGSAHEREVWRLVVACSRPVGAVAPGLLDEVGPTAAEVTRRIGELAGLSEATARRRAQTILAWRGRLVG